MPFDRQQLRVLRKNFMHVLQLEREGKLPKVIGELATFDPMAANPSNAFAEIGQRAETDATSVSATLALAAFFSHAARRYPKRVELLRSSLAKSVDMEKISALFSQFEEKGASLVRGLVRWESLQKAMAALQDCSAACDLRYLEDVSGAALVPVALIRLSLAEGDDVVFQCTAGQLDWLMGMLSGVADKLKVLKRIAGDAKL